MFNASLSLVYITVSTYSLALFDCTKENDGFYYLDSDPSLRCYDDWWYSDLSLSIFALIFYVIGIPCYLGLILYFARNDPLGGRKWIRIKKLCTSITANDNSYKPTRKEYTFFQIFQKLVLVIVSMFFTGYISFQIILIVYMLMISFYVTAKFRPYVHESLNYLEIYSVGSNIVILTLGLLFYNNQYVLSHVSVGLITHEKVYLSLPNLTHLNSSC
ncbi:hypothetical protein BKA69DRAFT_74910 [Paraphysoderma sedebokerense]|nr:hypothetical protein BKA69DRAFT_74910 [Paraphysoderma sedebokerense]